jgi:UDP-2,3-diacylglucosamine pyrophosphatase LpxH
MKEAWIISDLHLGDGKNPGLEDFRDDDLLVSWLGAKGGSDCTLVINGDFIDFLQIELDPPPELFPAWALWDEATSVRKLQQCFAAHDTVFAALRNFVATGSTLLFTIGNHDLDLSWEAVQEAIRLRLGDASTSVKFALQHILFDRVHVEHGHRFTGENRPERFEDFIRPLDPDDSSSVKVLECVWGSRFVLEALNPLESDHPYIDNVKPTWKLAWHMLGDGDWLKHGRAKTLLELIRFFRRTGVPIRDMANNLLDIDAAVTTTNLENMFLPEEDKWRALVRQVRAEDADGQLGDALALLPDDGSDSLAFDRLIALGEPVELDRGAADDLVHGDVNPAAGAHADLGIFRESREIRGAQECLKGKGIVKVVFGHTHEIIDGWKNTLWNPGSWIEHLDTRTEPIRAKAAAMTYKQIVDTPDLFTTDPRAVHIVFDGHDVEVDLQKVRSTL